MASISALHQQAIDQRRRRCLEARAQAAHHRRRQGAVEHGAALAVQGRVDLQDHARPAQRRMRQVVAQPDAAAGDEALEIHQHRMHLLMPANAEHRPAPGQVVRLQHRQAHHRGRLAHRGVAGIGVVVEMRG
jgi:hypothetical protein